MGNTDIVAAPLSDANEKNTTEPVSYTHLDVYKRQLKLPFKTGDNGL